MATAQTLLVRSTGRDRGGVRAVLLLPMLACTLAAAGYATTGCTSSRDLGMSDSTYVAAMGGLERLEHDGAGRTTQAQRDSVMRAAGVTVAELERAAEVLARQPARASALWRAIDRRSRDTPD